MSMWQIHIDFLMPFPLHAARSDFRESVDISLTRFYTVSISMLKINFHIFVYFCALINYKRILYFSTSEGHLPACGAWERHCHTPRIITKNRQDLFFLELVSDYCNLPLPTLSFSMVNSGLKILTKNHRNKQWMSFKTILSSMINSCAILFYHTWNVNHPFVLSSHTVLVSHLLII